MEEIALRTGEQTTVALPGLGTAGYQWSAVAEDPAVVAVEALGTVPAGPERGRTGSRDEQFALKGVGAGETVVHFRQARRFEPDKPPHATHDIRVRVS